MSALASRPTWYRRCLLSLAAPPGILHQAARAPLTCCVLRPACPPAHPPTRLTCPPTHLPACLPNHVPDLPTLPAHLPACLPAYPTMCLACLSCLLTCPLACLPDRPDLCRTMCTSRWRRALHAISAPPAHLPDMPDLPDLRRTTCTSCWKTFWMTHASACAKHTLHSPLHHPTCPTCPLAHLPTMPTCPPAPPAQDNVHQPLEDVLDYSSFSIRMRKTDVPRMMEVLRAITPHQIQAYRHNMWVEGGLNSADQLDHDEFAHNACVPRSSEWRAPRKR